MAGATLDSLLMPPLLLLLLAPLLLGAEVVVSIDIFFVVLLLPVVVVVDDCDDDCDELLLFSCGSLTSPILLSISLQLLVFLFDATSFGGRRRPGDINVVFRT